MRITRLCEDATSHIPKRKLGKTGYQVGILSLGGQGALETQRGRPKEMVELIQRAIELGINYIDSAPTYGPSEKYYGEALEGLRKQVFIASKTEDRTRDGSLRIIEASLKRLKTDYLDLWQLHHVDHMGEVDQITADDGALQALIEMKEQGVVKHLGFTSHETPKAVIELSKRFEFDTALVAINVADKHVAPSFIKTFLPEAQKQKLGVIGMKIFAQGFVFHPRGITTAWEALTYAISQSLSTVIVGCDNIAQLEENVAIAKAFVPLTSSQTKTIEERTKRYTKRAQFFRSKFGGYASRAKLGKPYTITGRKP